MVGILQGATGASLFPTAPSAQSVLLDQIRATAAERFQQEKEAIDSASKSKSEALDAESERYVTVKAQINNAKIAVDSGKESITLARNLLLELRTSIYLAGEPGEDSKFRATEFDTKVAAINGEADSGGRAFNLVGYIDRTDFTPNSIEYRNNLGEGSTTLNGTYIGTDWRVRAADGKVWVPDLEADTLTQYSDIQGVIQKTTLSDGTETDKTTSTRNGIELVSYNPNTKAITFKVTIDPTLPPETVTGTLEQTGIGLMGSWFYQKLANSLGRDAAFDAIDTAEIELTSREAVLEQASALVGRDSRRVDQEIERISGEKSDVLLKQLKETENLQVTTVQQILAMQVNLDAMSQQQQYYLQAFAGFVRSPFLRINLQV
ncbi:MAG: hypothetical protein FJX59_18835 [Alphaproteobacteria bacterium]|nr:hypothetical protein [Alphaproteobacteria bacterium]